MTQVPDPARAKRQAERQARVSAGLAELRLWLEDLVRQGLATVQPQPYRFWDAPAARLVDAQAPGLARMVRDLAGVSSSGEGWPGRLLERLGRIHLLVSAYERIDALPPDLQADVRTAIGFAERQEDVLERTGYPDVWAVVGRVVEDQDPLRAQRTWLIGLETGQTALLLSFAHVSQALDQSLAPGGALEATLAFYPGGWPLRALIKPAPVASTPTQLPGTDGKSSAATQLPGTEGESSAATQPPGTEEISSAATTPPATDRESSAATQPPRADGDASAATRVTGADGDSRATLRTGAAGNRYWQDEDVASTAIARGAATVPHNLDRYAQALGANPWLEQLPFILRALTPRYDERGWAVVDEAGDRLELSPTFTAPWALLALSGGRPIDLFGEWDGQRLLPLSVVAEGRFVAFDGGR